MGAEMIKSLNERTRTDVGFAAIKSVIDMAKEDHTPSFFLAETLKYLYLLQAEHSIDLRKYVFNTEAHPTRVFF